MQTEEQIDGGRSDRRERASGDRLFIPKRAEGLAPKTSRFNRKRSLPGAAEAAESGDRQSRVPGGPERSAALAARARGHPCDAASKYSSRGVAGCPRWKGVRRKPKAGSNQGEGFPLLKASYLCLHVLQNEQNSQFSPVFDILKVFDGMSRKQRRSDRKEEERRWMVGDDITPGGNKPLSKSEQDFIDLQNELAGAETGRRPRFLSEPNTPTAIEKRKQEDRARISRLLDLLQHDPAYAALYSQTMDLLGHAEAATAMALQETEEVLDRAKQDMNELEQRASTLPDGARIYRDISGAARRSDGSLVEDHLLETIHWRPNAPGYEEYLTAKKTVEQAQKRVDALRFYQVDVLGDARHRLTDPPLSKDDLQQLQKEIKGKDPASLKAEIAPDTQAAPHTVETSAAASTPKL